MTHLTTRQRSLIWFAVAFACSVGGFVALFKGGLDSYVAGGLAIVCFAGFLWAIGPALRLWDEQGDE